MKLLFTLMTGVILVLAAWLGIAIYTTTGIDLCTFHESPEDWS